MNALAPIAEVEDRILLIRGHKIILDADLAALYGVTTKRLNQQVNRNQERFPEDFAFSLTPTEKAEVVAKCNHLHNLKFSNVTPRAFTEHGAVMAASVLNTPVAVRASLFVVRAFVRMRSMVDAHKEIAGIVEKLIQRVGMHDEQIRGLFDAIRELMTPPPPKPKPRIGYRVAD